MRSAPPLVRIASDTIVGSSSSSPLRKRPRYPTHASPGAPPATLSRPSFWCPLPRTPPAGWLSNLSQLLPPARNSQSASLETPQRLPPSSIEAPVSAGPGNRCTSEAAGDVRTGGVMAATPPSAPPSGAPPSAEPPSAPPSAVPPSGTPASAGPLPDPTLTGQALLPHLGSAAAVAAAAAAAMRPIHLRMLPPRQGRCRIRHARAASGKNSASGLQP